MRTRYVMRNGSLEKLAEREALPESLYIVGDTMDPLRNMVTGKVHDSKSSYMREVDSLGLEVVGNDLLSRKPRNQPDRFTEAMILDRIERAEAIYNDPAKRREVASRNERILERQERLLNGRNR